MAPRTFQISLIGCDCLKGFILPCNLSFQKDLVHILWLDTIRDLRLVALGFGFVDRELGPRLVQNCNVAMKPSLAENVIHILLCKISTKLNLDFREFGMRKRSAAWSFVTWHNTILLTERSLQSYTLAIKKRNVSAGTFDFMQWWKGAGWCIHKIRGQGFTNSVLWLQT